MEMTTTTMTKIMTTLYNVAVDQEPLKHNRTTKMTTMMMRRIAMMMSTMKMKCRELD